ncbi:MAG: nitroreductase family protein [Bacteroidales bacterium]
MNNTPLDAIINRWSPRAFSNKEIESEKIELLFEAARWAPSSRNEQPWSYYYTIKNEQVAFDRFIDCLNPGNRVWAKHAAILVLSVAKKHFDYKDLPNRHALHDTGAANAYLVLQAAELGLQGHQMAGFDKEKTLKAFSLDPEKYDPVTFIALGYVGDPNALPDDLKESETASRKRKDKSEFVKKIKS